MRRNNTAKVLVGLFCLPTSSKYHCSDRERSGAFQPGQFAYVLEATQPVDQGGYPPKVVLTSDRDLEMTVGSEPSTQHAEVRKNLPPRRVVGIVLPDGTVEGAVPPKGEGLPHWSFIEANEDGSASVEGINAARAALESRRTEVAAAKEAARDAKKAAKKAA